MKIKHVLPAISLLAVLPALSADIKELTENPELWTLTPQDAKKNYPDFDWNDLQTNADDITYKGLKVESVVLHKGNDDAINQVELIIIGKASGQTTTLSEFGKTASQWKKLIGKNSKKKPIKLPSFKEDEIKQTSLAWKTDKNVITLVAKNSTVPVKLSCSFYYTPVGTKAVKTIIATKKRIDTERKEAVASAKQKAKEEAIAKEKAAALGKFGEELKGKMVILEEGKYKKYVPETAPKYYLVYISASW